MRRSRDCCRELRPFAAGRRALLLLLCPMRAGGALLARACDVIADAPIVIVYLFSSGILIDLGRAVSSCGRDTNFSRRLRCARVLIGRVLVAGRPAPDASESAESPQTARAADSHFNRSRVMPLLTFRGVEASSASSDPFYSSDVDIRRHVVSRRLSEDSTSMAAKGVCRKLPASFALTRQSMLDVSSNGTVFVTFSDRKLSMFALNWARRLQAVGVRSLVGVSERLDEATERAIREAGASLFCAEKADMMVANGQAGRWAEAVPILRMARMIGLSVLLSDADIAWIRNPLPYFAAARATHPGIDLLMMTDRAFNGYTASPLRVQPPRDSAARAARMGTHRAGNPILGGLRRIAGAAARKGGQGGDGTATGGDVDLDLEPGFESSISYNIGVILFCRHALRQLEDMVGRWVLAVGGVYDDETSSRPASSRLFGRAHRPVLAAWDQEPINKQVLQVGLAPDGSDRRLVRVDRGRIAMGVLPMLQFTTAFTYHAQRRRRDSLRARPYCLHAIFAHGKDTDRKISIFREERLWHDPPEYYDPRADDGKTPAGLLVADPVVLPSLRAQGGFEILQAQLAQVRAALRLAALLNRTLVLPRLKCGERPLAYPCYAWYHRAMAYFGLNTDKVSMPEYCPMYYWLDLRLLTQLPVATREPSFLDNPRTPSSLKSSVGRIKLCARSPCGEGEAAGGDGGGGSGEGSSSSGNGGGGFGGGGGDGSIVHVAGTASPSELLAALRANPQVERARVLRVQHMQWLSLSDTALRSGGDHGGDPGFRPLTSARLPSRQTLEQLTKGFWCSACPVTRRGAVIHELNRSSLHMLETFCKTEARGRLGLGPPMRSCCPHGQRLPCHQCQPNERGTINETHLPWTTRAWIPLYARLELPKSAMGASMGAGSWPVCTHPLCTGADRKNFP